MLTKLSNFTTSRSPTAAQCESLLYRCATTKKSLAVTKKLHAHYITSGLLSTHFLSLLTSAYGLCGHVTYACKLFDELPEPTLGSYKAMIRMYTEIGNPRSALELFKEMHESSCYSADEYTYPFVIRACGNLVLLELGSVIHGLTVKGGFVSAIFVGNSLLSMYMNCGHRTGARRLFEEMRDKTVVSWNTMISGYFRNDNANEALMIFRKMLDTEVEIDFATLLSVLPACGYLKEIELGRSIHLLIKEKGLWQKLAVQNALLDMYVKCGRTDEAREVFYGMMEKDVVTWTTLINGYASNGDANSALDLCRLMQLEGVMPNEMTLASLFSMSANLPNLKLGKCLHGWSIRQNIECDVNVETALIDLYAKCNSVRLSYIVFSRTSKKRTVPWNSILSGYVHNKLTKEAIQLFKKMLIESVKLNDATWKSILPAYAIEADVQQAMNIHGYVIRLGFIKKPEIVTGLIDIYSKCGSLQYARNLFDTMSAKKRDIVSWSSIIAGYGKHGHGEVALSLFNQMVQSGVKPNEVTFTSTLHACGHAGLVDDGLNLFNFMQKNSQESLRTDHYTCMVDLLGRADRLVEAYNLINTMPFEPNHAVWGALLGACVIHENVELGEVAAERLFELEPENTGNYVLMGNIYSAVGRFDDAERMRRVMDSIGLVKTPANSVMSIDGNWRALGKLLIYCSGCEKDGLFSGMQIPGHFVYKTCFSRTSGKSFLLPQCRNDVLYVSDPCEHLDQGEEGDVGFFHGIFKSFATSKVRKMLISKNAHLHATEVCPYCKAKLWNMLAAKMVPTSASCRLGAYDDCIEYYMFLNGHVLRICTLLPLSDSEEAEE